MSDTDRLDDQHDDQHGEQHGDHVVAPQLRRLQRALVDLGAPVPDGWARSADDGRFVFGSLSPRQFDRLVCLLEDLAEHRPVEVTIMGGPRLFDPSAPAGPVPAPRVSSVHMVVPQ